MEDKLIMDTILTAVKSECDLMMHGALESSTANIHATFTQIFNDNLCMQNEIYNKMAEKGWYPATQADSAQINATKQKYQAEAN